MPALLFVLFACVGLNARAVPTHDIYADDGDVQVSEERVEFAVVGDLRPAVPGEAQVKGRAVTPRTQAAVVADISDAVQAGRARFVVLLGDLVRSSTTAEWKAFARDWSLVLSGSEIPEMGKMRVRTLPVAGNHDRIGDVYLAGFGAAFPGVGADIGYNRVATWYRVDLDVKGHRWRLLFLDSDRARLGSRWDEQLAWIPTALDGGYDSLLVFMHHPLVTLAKGHPSNEGGAPRDLLAVVEDTARIGVLKAVFGAHVHTNEVFLPSGRFGELFVNAGGGGSPADSLARWGHAREAGYEDVKLEPIYDLALMREFERWSEERGFPQAVVDHAAASGSYEGFVGEFDARHFPIQGWWTVALDGEALDLTFRMVGPDGTLKDVYIAQHKGKDGWRIGK